MEAATSPKQRRRRLILGLVLLILIALLALPLAAAWRELKVPYRTGQPDQVVFIPKGYTSRQVARDLAGRGLIPSAWRFTLYARLKGLGGSLKAGEYRLNAALSPEQILGMLHRGEVLTHLITIPEGFTIDQIAALLGQQGITDSRAFATLAHAPATAQRYGIQAPSMEGYLYPDSYAFARDLSPSKVLDIMARRLQRIMVPLAEQVRASGLTLEEVITLAAMVEKETGQPAERPLIAGVFLNRLRRKMRLESDPTVIYGLCDFDGNLRRRDLSRPSPYNTYVIRGLPPGPICSPGLAAIEAVLAPAPSDFLYFVAKNDGSHHFSATFAEHQEAVRQYQKRGRGSRP